MSSDSAMSRSGWAPGVLTANGKDVRLTPKEFDLLPFLPPHPDTALSHEQILQAGGPATKSSVSAFTSSNGARNRATSRKSAVYSSHLTSSVGARGDLLPSTYSNVGSEKTFNSMATIRPIDRSVCQITVGCSAAGSQRGQVIWRRSPNMQISDVADTRNTPHIYFPAHLAKLCWMDHGPRLRAPEPVPVRSRRRPCKTRWNSNDSQSRRFRA
jgi:hypothetical protein